MLENKEPITEFEDSGLLRRCAKEWINRLGLNHWSIKVDLAERVEMSSQNNLGENECSHINRSSSIKIAILDTFLTEGCQKVPQEFTLVHELLHCIFSLPVSDSLEGRFFEVEMHSKIDLIAQALIMTKYNISVDWFNNF